MKKTIVGLFDSVEDARQAEQQLYSSGFPKDSMCIHAHNYENSYNPDMYSSDDSNLRSGEIDEDSSKQGGFMQSIRNMFANMFGEDHEDAGHYSEAVRRGSTVLSVTVDDDSRVEKASEILSQAGAINIDNRVAEWRQGGYTGFDDTQQPYSAEQAATERSHVIPVIKEELEVGKREVDQGAVRVYSHLVETPVSENINLREEHAAIKRRPVDREATPEELNAFKDESIEIRETAEKAVVNKTARVVEEVEVDTEESTNTETINDTVRSTEVDIERQNQKNRSDNRPNQPV
jgi:uncharacterized protein (TIGR02271 family)